MRQGLPYLGGHPDDQPAAKRPGDKNEQPLLDRLAEFLPRHLAGQAEAGQNADDPEQRRRRKGEEELIILQVWAFERPFKDVELLDNRTDLVGWPRRLGPA